MTLAVSLCLIQLGVVELLNVMHACMQISAPRAGTSNMDVTKVGNPLLQ